MEIRENIDSGARNYFEGNEWILPPDPRMNGKVVAEVEKRLQDNGWSDDDIFKIKMGVTEAMANAINYGALNVPKKENEESKEYNKRKEQAYEQQKHEDKKILVVLNITPDEFAMVIRDPGKGFDPNSVPNPMAPENLLKQGGRGLFLMKTFFDSVTHSAKGNEVTLKKKRTPDQS